MTTEILPNLRSLISSCQKDNQLDVQHVIGEGYELLWCLVLDTRLSIVMSDGIVRLMSPCEKDAHKHKDTQSKFNTFVS